MDTNPRANGFNYGVGWGPTPKPPIYHEAQELARIFGRAANAASRKAWALEMAIRTVRLAETPTEKECSISALTELMLQYQRQLTCTSLPRDHAGHFFPHSAHVRSRLAALKPPSRRGICLSH